LSDLQSPALIDFVAANRSEIDLRIRELSPGFSDITDADRRLWVLTIDELKDWSVAKGLIT
jgi:hypothetical protein